MKNQRVQKKKRLKKRDKRKKDDIFEKIITRNRSLIIFVSETLLCTLKYNYNYYVYPRKMYHYR